MKNNELFMGIKALHNTAYKFTALDSYMSRVGVTELLDKDNLKDIDIDYKYPEELLNFESICNKTSHNIVFNQRAIKDHTANIFEIRILGRSYYFGKDVELKCILPCFTRLMYISLEGMAKHLSKYSHLYLYIETENKPKLIKIFSSDVIEVTEPFEEEINGVSVSLKYFLVSYNSIHSIKPEYCIRLDDDIYTYTVLDVLDN